MTTLTAKESRLQARLSSKQKALLERAAALQGMTLSDFVVSAAQSRAEEVIRDKEVIYLSVEASERFADALRNPPKPTKAARALAKHYRTAGRK